MNKIQKPLIKDDNIRKILVIVILLIMIILLISPIDLIPDIIPIFGWIDDLIYLAVIVAILADSTR